MTNPRPLTPDARGFTLIELLIVLTIAAFLIIGLQQALIGQRQFYETQGALSVRNESVRTAMAVLGAALREASVPDGDVDVLGPRRLRIRMPVGSGVVCGANDNGSRIGLVTPRGAWIGRSTDSVMLRRGSGRYVDLLDRVDPPSDRVPCLTASPGLIIRPDERVPDVEVPSSARAFRSQLLESVVENGYQYLYREDTGGRELLVGPLEAADGFRAWYVDLQGDPVTDPALADRVQLRVIAQAPDVRGRATQLRDTLLLSFGGRNR